MRTHAFKPYYIPPIYCLMIFSYFAPFLVFRAQSDSKAILDEYEKEADSYKQLKDANSLDNQGFLAYMGIRAISNAKNPVHIGMKAPARSSYA